MIPYSSGIISDNTNKNGVVKTETLFDFGSSNRENLFDSSFDYDDTLQWIIASPFNGRSLRDMPEKTAKMSAQKRSKGKIKKIVQKRLKKPHHKRKGNIKKCFLKLFKKHGKKNKHSKYMLPLVIGLLAVKSVLITILVKALAIISAKGLMMGFFSTALALILSLKGAFDHSHGYQNRKDDTNTRLEIIRVPIRNNEHLYYDDHNSRGDFMPNVQSSITPYIKA